MPRARPIATAVEEDEIGHIRMMREIDKIRMSGLHCRLYYAQALFTRFGELFSGRSVAAAHYSYRGFI
jgi:hypothetical protein